MQLKDMQAHVGEIVHELAEISRSGRPCVIQQKQKEKQKKQKTQKQKQKKQKTQKKQKK